MGPAAKAGVKRSADEIDSQDDFTSVYGSRYATQDLPVSDIPDNSMPPEIAYRMIKDELSLDNNPKLKYVNSQDSLTYHQNFNSNPHESICLEN